MFEGVSAFFAPPPDAPVSGPGGPARNREYEARRWSVFLSVTIGYAVFYLCRINFSVAKMALLEDDVLDASEMGVIGSAMLVAYAAGKLVNGFLSDRVSVRRFIATALLASAGANLLFGLNVLVPVFVALWALNGWFQSCGAAPSVVALSHWFTFRERGTRYGIWSMSHPAGEALTFAVTGALVGWLGWRWGFLGPGLVAAGGALILFRTLQDRPQAYGLPPVWKFRGEPEPTRDQSTNSGRREPEAIRDAGQATTGFLAEGVAGTYVEARVPVGNEPGARSDPAQQTQSLRTDPQAAAEPVGRLQLEVLRNPAIWVLGLASATMYVARYGMDHWGPMFLQVVKGYSQEESGFVMAMSPIAALAGTALSGLVSDRLFGSRRQIPVLIYGLVELAALAGLYLVPPGNDVVLAASLLAFGFGIGGLTVFLGGLMAVDLVPPRAAGAAMGLIGVFSYLGAAVQDTVSGVLIDASETMVDGKPFLPPESFDGAFLFWIATSVASLLLAVSLWYRGKGR
jgi:OPA family sugar phosphate sensor protein UhpC-like MFS transporter